MNDSILVILLWSYTVWTHPRDVPVWQLATCSLFDCQKCLVRRRLHEAVRRRNKATWFASQLCGFEKRSARTPRTLCFVLIADSPHFKTCNTNASFQNIWYIPFSVIQLLFYWHDILHVKQHKVYLIHMKIFEHLDVRKNLHSYEFH